MIIRVSVEDIKNKIKELIYIKENEPENALIVGRRIRNWATLSKYWTYTYRNMFIYTPEEDCFFLRGWLEFLDTVNYNLSYKDPITNKKIYKIDIEALIESLKRIEQKENYNSQYNRSINLKDVEKAISSLLNKEKTLEEVKNWAQYLTNGWYVDFYPEEKKKYGIKYLEELANLQDINFEKINNIHKNFLEDCKEANKKYREGIIKHYNHKNLLKDYEYDGLSMGDSLDKFFSYVDENKLEISNFYSDGMCFVKKEKFFVEIDFYLKKPVYFRILDKDYSFLKKYKIGDIITKEMKEELELEPDDFEDYEFYISKKYLFLEFWIDDVYEGDIHKEKISMIFFNSNRYDRYYTNKNREDTYHTIIESEINKIDIEKREISGKYKGKKYTFDLITGKQK
ncbi:hypothetical protein RN96_02105 [Fusobacterium polymorphum]|uniref:Uncharacterized protein n=1 Tax=Fusobacterium nucleatum subsp. polymorphum TaxID=76857 RepID=A0A2B7YD51_FUSNP|nr:hypothetical protein [Fusobacterium polymorphum]PGH22004.1 hypothetical protein RN96_02105 [Fusobacterium polymorphum]